MISPVQVDLGGRESEGEQGGEWDDKEGRIAHRNLCVEVLGTEQTAAIEVTGHFIFFRPYKMTQRQRCQVSLMGLDITGCSKSLHKKGLFVSAL